MEEQNIFKKKAQDGYEVCLTTKCPRKKQCLRWLVGQYIPDTRSVVVCVNMKYNGVETDSCPLFRLAEKVQMAKGMTHIFNGDMPKRVEPFVRQKLISHHCRTYYYEFRNGTRLIPPAIQEEIRSLFREAGWNKEVKFDSYIEDYLW